MKQCIIHNVHGSNFGNLMMKYICAMKIKSRAQDSILSNYDMPYWNISCPHLDKGNSASFHFHDDQRINIDFAAYLAQSGLIGTLEMYGHYQRMENLLSREQANSFFPRQNGLGTSFGGNFLVCPIRGGETLEAIHPGYGLVPINFYKEIVSKFNLIPVFMGQTESNPYMDLLRQTFADAIFLPPQGAIQDFETIRNSVNIVVPVSTFAWLAAWLSNAVRIIFPVFGLFNPNQFPDHDLIPLGDQRYEFYQFPIHHAVHVRDFAVAHQELDGRWSLVDSISFLARG